MTLLIWKYKLCHILVPVLVTQSINQFIENLCMAIFIIECQNLMYLSGKIQNICWLQIVKCDDLFVFLCFISLEIENIWIF